MLSEFKYLFFTFPWIPLRWAWLSQHSRWWRDNCTEHKWPLHGLYRVLFNEVSTCQTEGQRVKRLWVIENFHACILYIYIYMQNMHTHIYIYIFYWWLVALSIWFFTRYPSSIHLRLLNEITQEKDVVKKMFPARTKDSKTGATFKATFPLS